MIFAASEHPDNNKRPHTHTQLKQLNSLKDCFCMFAVIGYKKSVWGLKVMSRACELLERYVRESKSTIKPKGVGIGSGPKFTYKTNKINSIIIQ